MVPSGQVGEEAAVRTILGELRFAHADPTALLLLDRELPTPPQRALVPAVRSASNRRSRPPISVGDPPGPPPRPGG